MTQAHARLYGADFKEALERRSPAGAATIESVVDAIEFLMSPQARHITGAILRVDGGAVL
jgi:NAD(P)-dependent dehydrogenase (short-subunit alcohol dehydrogenase family)